MLDLVQATAAPGLATALSSFCLLSALAPSSSPIEDEAARDARLAWWREARFGLFIHWSLFCVPEGTWNGERTEGLGEWIMDNKKIPVAAYRALAPRFNPVRFDAEQWVSIAQAAGVKYIVFTAKHHDGFAMFASKADPFNIVEATPYGRDPLRELAEACRKQGMPLGFYYSQAQDWTAPGGATFGGHPRWDPAQEGSFPAYLETKAIPQLRELLENYAPAPAIVWFDTPTEDVTPELARKIVAVLREHPGLIWNDRLGGGERGDTETPEEVIPDTGFPRDWETCMNINDTWGYKSFDTNFKSTETLLRNLIDIASKNGNYLLNVGPTPEGVIPPPQVDRLLAMGAWLRVNGEAIYGTTGSPFAQPLPWGRATQKSGRIYLSVFDWPPDGKLHVPIANARVTACLLAEPDCPLPTEPTPAGRRITLPATARDPIASVIRLELDGPVRLAT